jgi:hypothetical protein
LRFLTQGGFLPPVCGFEDWPLGVCENAGVGIDAESAQLKTRIEAIKTTQFLIEFPLLR